MAKPVVKDSINLLQPELIVKAPFLTLTKMLLLWGLIALAMAVWAGVNQQQFARLSKQVQLLQTEQNQLKARQEQLEAQIKSRQPDARLNQEVDTLAKLAANREALQQQLTDKSKVSVTGFANAMTELSDYHDSDISLQYMTINNDAMAFVGVAKSADAVPRWLTGFERSKLLSGQRFSQLKLEKNKQGYTLFTVATALDFEQEKAEQ